MGGETDPGETDPGLLGVSCCVSVQDSVPQVKSHLQHFFVLSRVIRLALDDNRDERHIPVTFCHEFVRRLPLDCQGKYTELQ